MAVNSSAARELFPPLPETEEVKYSQPRRQPKIGDTYRVIFVDTQGNYLMTEMRWLDSGWEDQTKNVVDWFEKREKPKSTWPLVFDFEIEDDAEF